MKEFIVIWIGQLISSIGSGMTAFAVSIYVYQSTGSATLVSLAALLAFLPTILLNPVGGVLADRYDRRLMMILGYSLSALGLLFMLISIQTGHRGIMRIFNGRRHICRKYREINWNRRRTWDWVYAHYCWNYYVCICIYF